jgi:inhibitor of cysteine peptidase
MKNQIPISAGMVLVIAVLTACAGVAPGPKTLTDVDNGKTVQLRNGEKLVVMLTGNPTTGYTWDAVLPADSIVRQIGQAEFTPESNQVGAGGKVTLTFQAVNPGQGPLQLVYHRPFESDVAPLQVFTVNVVVK